jgi:hypothetical protein
MGHFTAEASALTAAKTEKSHYLVGPVYDWAFFILCPLAALAIGIVLARTGLDEDHRAPRPADPVGPVADANVLRKEETHAERSGWHLGQNQVPRPAILVFSIEVRQRRHGSPVRP